MFGVDFPNRVDSITKSYFLSEAVNTTSTDNFDSKYDNKTANLYTPCWKYMSNSESKENVYYSYAVA